MLGDLFPGGYVFSTVIFWAVLGLVIVGTNLVPIALTVGLGLLVLEAVTGGRS